ncbi:hypothetical protein BCR39DRAFT_525501 [Naematelia encephala]|uniref:ASTRA-associated protein 1 n=1 Tax=Naematelia encephala TaxID=71784 RepID=A0A1Y2BAD2_9TREE|nr:hypothetical protein BCR39DRAFT_525501 [Naematelia encephala]
MTSPPIPLHIIRSHTAALSTAIFNPDNSLLYSADQEGWISVLDLRVRRVVCHWKAHDGGVLGLAEWQGGLISHGRDNHIHIYSPLKRPFLGRDPPLIVKTLDVNSLNFCSFSLTPRSSTTTTEAEGFLAVPSLTDSELADIYHLPSCKRLHAAIGFSPNKDATEEARSGLIMGIHLAWYGSRLVLIMGFEDGRVEVWRCAESGEDQLWDARSGRDPLWAKVWAGKGHNEAGMLIASDPPIDKIR